MKTIRTNLIVSAAMLSIALLGWRPHAFAKDKNTGPVTPEIRPNLLAEVPGLEVQKAQKPCDNWAWWAAVQSTYEQQNVALPQAYFVDHADGGACLNQDEHPTTMYDVATEAAGDYASPNGRRYHAEVTLGKTAVPVAMIIGALRAGRPLIMEWRKRPYVVQGIVFDDRVFPGDQHQFQARELRLIDPANGEKVKLALEDEQAVSEIVGVMDVVVTELKK